jgi:hypothetical protein
MVCHIYIKRIMCLLMMKHIFDGTVQSETYSVINHCDRRTTHLGGWDISFVLYISITKKSDTSITVIYHTMSLTTVTNNFDMMYKN